MEEDKKFLERIKNAPDEMFNMEYPDTFNSIEEILNILSLDKIEITEEDKKLVAIRYMNACMTISSLKIQMKEIADQLQSIIARIDSSTSENLAFLSYLIDELKEG